MSTLLAESETLALLQQYNLAGRTEQRPLSASANPGVVLTIDCSNDSPDGAHINVTIAKHIAKRQLPLGAYEAETLVDEFHAERLLTDDPATRSMIAHVFTRFSGLFTENSAIVRLRCERLHIEPSDYRIEKVTIWIDSPLHVRARLTAHAHDRKAMFGKRSGSKISSRRSFK